MDAEACDGPMNEAPASLPMRVCVACEAPAAYHHHEADIDLCQACGIYIAGQYHGEVTIARELLAEAIGELLAVGLTHEHILITVSGELEGVHRPTGPDIAYPEDPRPWVAYLLHAIRHGGEDGR